ncbi:capsule biosynthesis protein [Rahnella aquatilis]|nr:capsule polysaccharide transporter [Rahnella aceris]AFE57554.1 capsule polysaccharide export inner-membrane protein KpsE [Rahnella aquatilis HX2]AYA09326.1 capsule biosynthesis protein [Rahnella aquatilis]AZP53288.1 capsule biosynthesis protein [Rahnella aquatilis]MBU9859102.1 capsule biosynthesis protein [Rahnella aceris]MBU9864953.1 capsule biosynthesis protein [Rahnella aceris]
MKSAWPGEHIARVRRSPYFSMATLNRNLGKIVIGLPMALLIIYLVIFSRPRYLSESTVAIKSSNDISGTSLNVGLLLGAGNPGTAQDAMYLKEYINSPDMLTALDKQLDFHSVFGRSGLDFLYHLPKDASREQFLNYYRDRIAVTYDDKSGLLTIGTQGFTPQFAEQFNKAVLKESERFINEISHKIARDQQAFAENEMLEARARLNASKAQLLAYQNHNNILDPEAQAIAATTLVNTLVGQKIQMEAELRNLLTYLRDDAPQVISAQNAITSLGKQIDQEKSKITAPDGRQLNTMAVDFEEIKSKVQFDTELYKLTLTSIEKTRVEAARKLKVLSVISSPQLPQETTFPNVPYMIASWLLVCCLLFGTIKLLLAVIDDHKD